MKNFWCWMEKEGYGHIGEDYTCLYNKDDTEQEVSFPMKQMLIGYMIEYINDMEHLYQLCSCKKSVEELYDCLEKMIKKLEGGEVKRKLDLLKK